MLDHVLADLSIHGMFVGDITQRFASDEHCTLSHNIIVNWMFINLASVAGYD